MGIACFLTRNDKFVETITRPGKSKMGQGVFGSGTGKFAGITGQVSLPPLTSPTVKNGTVTFIGKRIGSYALP